MNLPTSPEQTGAELSSLSLIQNMVQRDPSLAPESKSQTSLDSIGGLYNWDEAQFCPPAGSFYTHSIFDTPVIPRGTPVPAATTPSARRKSTVGDRLAVPAGRPRSDSVVTSEDESSAVEAADLESGEEQEVVEEEETAEEAGKSRKGSCKTLPAKEGVASLDFFATETSAKDRRSYCPFYASKTDASLLSGSDGRLYVDTDPLADFEPDLGDHQADGSLYLDDEEDIFGQSSSKTTTATAAHDKVTLPPGGKDWNKEFRAALDMEDSLERHVELTKMTNDFCYAALSFAKIIIAELPLPFEAKSLKPLSVGGVAGGLKYAVNGILFKIAQDTLVSSNPPVWMYGGLEGPNDEAAIRAAHGELNGAECYYSTYLSDLNIPLISLITYRGFTITAMSILPVDKSTICYGSADGGRTVHDSDEQLNQLMDLAGQKLNLLKHQVGSSDVWISGPGDIEGHKGFDGRYYLLDFGRVMPPEAPSVDPEERRQDSRSVFYKFLRREFVTYSYYFRKGIKLCSDAFTNWDTISKPEVAKENAQTVRNATDYLFQVVAPEHARVLDEQAKEMLAHSSSGQLYDSSKFASLLRTLNRFTASYIFHGAGLNCRHMGRVLEHVRTPELKQVLLAGIAARAIKRTIETKMRQTMATISYPSACFEGIIVEHLNATLLCKTAERFWQEELPDQIEKLFPRALGGNPRAAKLMQQLDIPLTLVSLSLRLNITFTKRFKMDVVSCRQLGSLSMDVRDIKQFQAKIRNHYLIELSFADRDLKIADLHTEPATVARLMAYSRKAFLRLKKKLPFCPVLSEKLAFAYAREGLFHFSSRQNYEKARSLLRKACVHYEVAMASPLYKFSGYQGVFQRYYICLHHLSKTLKQLGEDHDAEQVNKLSLETHAMFDPEIKDYSEEQMLKMSAASLLPRLPEIQSMFACIPQRENMNCRDAAETYSESTA